MFLECAVFVKADFIISGDEDLLSLKMYGGILIISGRDILELLP